MAKMFPIPLSYNAIDFDGLARILKTYSGKHHNQIIEDFEKRIGEVTGSKFVLATNSGTASLHLSLRALGIGRGDEVIASSFTYVASINPILYLSAIPVLIDSEELTWNIDPLLLEKAIQERIAKGKLPKAILVVHAYGMPAQMNEVKEIADRFGIQVIEDAAEALGSTYFGKHLGTIGKIGVLSFNNNKLATTYGGGALLTNDETIYHKVKLWANQAREDKPYYEHEEMGYNYRISPVNAAVGLLQFENLEERILERRKIYEVYRSELADVAELNFAKEPHNFFSNRWLSTVLINLDEMSPELLQRKLFEKGIETRNLWKPMHLQPLCAGFSSYVNGTSERLFNSGLSLPSGTMEPADILKVIELLKQL